MNKWAVRHLSIAAPQAENAFDGANWTYSSLPWDARPHAHRGRSSSTLSYL